MYLGVDFWREFALAPEIIPCVSEVEILEESETSNFHDLDPEQNLRLEKVIMEFPSFEKLG